MRGKIYHIGKDKLSNELYIIDNSVSERHAQIVVDENGDVIIINLLSNSSVKVNSTILNSPFKIIKGDIITIGIFECLFEDIFKSISLFDFENQKGKKHKSIHLKSSINKDYLKDKKLNKKSISSSVSWYNNQKYLSIILIILFVIIISFLSFFFLNQNSLRKKLFKNAPNIENKDNSTDKVENKVKKTKKQRTDVTYDFSCLENENDQGTNKVITDFGDFTRNIQNVILNDVEVTVDEEEAEGEEWINMLKENYTFISSGTKLNKLKSIVIDLKARIAQPRGFDYEVYLIDDDQINALTYGGKIIVFTGLYDFCQSDDEITSVLAHEIAHNELGHITSQLKKNKSATNLGIPEDIVDIFLGIERNFFASFNQKQELEADLFGIDIMYPTRYKTCSAISLWKRMAEFDGNKNNFEIFFKSHPYSESRASCIKNHLTTNYNKSCKN